MMWFLAIAMCGAVGVYLFWQHVKQRASETIMDMIGVEDGEGITKHQQIARLEEIGINFRDEREKHQFLLHCTPDDSERYYRHPYDALLADAGNRGLLERVWSPLDRECVNEDDIYGSVLESLKAISKLPIENICGFDRYRVSFSVQGKEYLWNAKVNGDWLDFGLAGYLNWIFERTNSPQRERFYLDDTHVAPLYVFGSDELVERLNELPRMRFKLAKT